MTTVTAGIIALAAATCCMTLLWALHLRSGKVAIVDIGWTLITGGSVVFYAAVGHGEPALRLLVAALFAAWAVRLAAFLLITRTGRKMADDGRYQEIRKRWQDGAARKMWWMFAGQGLLAVLLASAWLPALQSKAAVGPVSWIAAALIPCLLAASAVTDWQLANFRRQHPGGVCRVGFWQYARHPNYFFEILTWWCLAAVVLPCDRGAWAAVAAAILTWLILKVTGIPLKEEQALRSRGDAYRVYMKETRLLLPLPISPK